MLSRSSAYAQAFEAIGRASSVEEAVFAIRDTYQLDHATYQFSRVVGGILDAPYVKSTYPAEWLTRYLLRGYIRVDPVVVEGFQRMLPFDWRELTLTEQANDLFVDFQAHGLGGHGWSVPVIDKVARRALFSVASRLPDREWDAFIREDGPGIAELAFKVHRMAIAEIHGESDPVPDLTKRELECLIWAAQGKDQKSIGAILGISEHTVRNYLDVARLKLDCASTTQAVAKAIKLRLINP
ncbi:MAG TPA: LuxR family transcriptional regulator [Rhizobiaceae bacterium]|nr:LuxR family transcriptional regulator [Rhizobiaceae bacterium]